MTNITKKIVAIVTTVTCAVWMMGPGIANALTAAELQALIDDLLAQIADLQAQLSDVGGTPTVSGCTITSFDRALKVGMTGDDVMCLQIVLNSATDTKLADSGVGSPGSETSYFGPLTQGGVIKFQEKYASEILASWGLTSGTGFVGSTTRAKLNEVLTASPDDPGDPGDPGDSPSTGQAAVSLAASTPEAHAVALAAQDAIAAKIRFAGGDDGVTITQITIKRGGIAADTDVSAIKLYDGTTQLGSSQALNTNTHKATFSSLNWQIEAGAVKYLTIKVSIAAKGTATVGDSIKMGIDSVNDVVSTGTLSGSFPMYGKALTIAGISVGELFVAVQGTPADATILSGATEQEIASWQLTASSSEAVEVHALRITHSGSAAATDVSNIKLKVNGVQIGDTVAALDNQNQATFDLSGAPISILASANKTVYAYADVSAGIWTSRTIIFEITQYTDVTVYGANSGGAIEAAASDTAAFSRQTGSTMTIGQGTLSINVDAAYNPASQNYVKGTTNRLMSAFKFTTGSREGVRVAKLRLRLNNGTGLSTDIANVTLWDGSTQIAGPASLIGTYVTFGANTIGWDSPGLFDVAKSTNKTIQVKADIPSGATTGRTVDMDIAAVTDVWIDGLDSQYDITQNTTNISLSSGNGNLHTISASGALSLALSGQTPSAQTYIKGSTQQEMIRVDLTADSGEDISVTSLTFDLKTAAAAATASGDFTNVKLYNVADNTQVGSTIASPTAEAAFSFSLTVPASQTVTLKVLTDIPSTTGLADAGGYFMITNTADITSEGKSSSAAITETGLSVTGRTMAVGQGSLTISAAATPGDQNIIIGAEQIPVVGLVLTAGSSEDVRLTRIKLTAASSNDGFGGDQSNLTNIALYDGATRLTAKKGWDGTVATTVTFSASDFLNSQGIDFTKGSQKTITVKADIPSTATNGQTIALGISSSSDQTNAGVSAGLVGTDDVTIVGIESNSNPTTTLSFNSAIGGVNFTTSSAANAQIAYITLANRGNLTVQSNADTPTTAMVAVGPYGTGVSDVVLLKVDFTAARENVDVKEIGIEKRGGNDADFSNLSLWDGTTQIGVDQVIVNSGQDHSSTTFKLNIGSYWTIPSGETKTLTIKADLNGTKTADQAGVTPGNTPLLCLASSTVAIGVSSGSNISPDTAIICGNSQILYRSKPTIAAASLPSTALSAGTKTLYRWTVTADSKGDIAWMKVVFDVTGSIQIGDDTYTIGAGGGPSVTNTSTNGIWMGTSSTQDNGLAKQLVATSSLKVYDVGTATEVTASSGDAFTYVWNYLSGGARVTFWPSAEQRIAAGTTKTYELRGDVLYNGKAGDNISTKIANRNTATSTTAFSNSHLFKGGADWDGATTNPDGVATTTNTFIWTDRSGAGATHSSGSSDWSHDYKVSGLPTATLSLSK